MKQPDLSAGDHAAEDDLIRFLFGENEELKSRITALEVRQTKDSHQTVTIPASHRPQMVFYGRRNGLPHPNLVVTHQVSLLLNGKFNPVKGVLCCGGCGGFTAPGITPG
ncbi:hypothetical protein [Acidithiobacillus ferrivorans]|uniref:Uncharacterized protein n=1 Tax=Acidithiobacillus ferrivorans TaxID=160808 RepID=A0A060UX64_9PROT|nr:hypothetical protein [Acidithiobacillus ferrivorans]CDQ11109.1 hypothetical protein AFERRI_530004 [Acidithiobacillus ferrivorans]